MRAVPAHALFKVHEQMIQKASWNNKLNSMAWRLDVLTKSRHIEEVGAPPLLSDDRGCFFACACVSCVWGALGFAPGECLPARPNHRVLRSISHTLYGRRLSSSTTRPPSWS